MAAKKKADPVAEAIADLQAKVNELGRALGIQFEDSAAPAEPAAEPDESDA